MKKEPWEALNKIENLLSLDLQEMKDDDKQIGNKHFRNYYFRQNLRSEMMNIK